jgi:hypothetical protein
MPWEERMVTQPDAQKFDRVVWQKAGTENGAKPVWRWQLKRAGAVVAFGERRSEQNAIEAAKLAEQRYGSSLGQML